MYWSINLKFVKNGGKTFIETDLYIKPSNRQLFLDWNSNHPIHCKKSIVYSQGLRYVMLSSSKKQLEENLSKLKDKFIQVHYPEEIIQEQFLRIEKINRKDLILKPRPSKKSKTKNKKALHISTFNSKNPPYARWFKELRPILDRDPHCKKNSRQCHVCHKTK